MDPVEEVPRPRGRGADGFCEECQVECPEGPDPCLGWIPGVTQACCGHGYVPAAFVFLGISDSDTEWAFLKEQDAIDFFELAKRATRVKPQGSSR